MFRDKIVISVLKKYYLDVCILDPRTSYHRICRSFYCWKRANNFKYFTNSPSRSSPMLVRMKDSTSWSTHNIAIIYKKYICYYLNDHFASLYDFSKHICLTIFIL
ncbi:hypothetical protein Leryth_022268, partial [Lithospermum erythrorhizon]